MIPIGAGGKRHSTDRLNIVTSASMSGGVAGGGAFGSSRFDGLQPPVAPTITASRINDTTIRFTFSGGSGASSWTGYYRTPAGSGSYSSVSLTVGQAYYDVTVSSGGTANFYIEAHNGAGATVNSSVATGSAGGGALYFEDWENATVGASPDGRAWGGTGGNWGDGKGSAYASVETTNPYAGSRSVRIRQIAENNGGSCQLGFDLGASFREVTINYKLFWPTNFAIRASGGGYAGPNNKFFRLWEDDGAGGDAGYSAYNGKLGASFYRMGSDSVAGLSPEGNPWNTAGLMSQLDDPEQFITSADFGTWIDFEIYCKAAVSGAGGADGARIQVKKNGAVVFNYTGLENWVDGEPHAYRYGYLLGAANTGYAAQTDWYIDDISFTVVA